MSHPVAHVDTNSSNAPAMKPLPTPRSRRTFELDSEPATPTETSPTLEANLKWKMSETPRKEKETASDVSRTRSFLNLTTSTLFGIYQDTGDEAGSSQPTPFGNGAQTPADTISSTHPSFDWARLNLPSNAFERKAPNSQTIRRKSFNPHIQKHYTKPATGVASYLPVLGRTTAMASVGVLYGLLISHLHDHQNFAAIEVNLDTENWSYLTIWGGIGAVLGEALPYVDRLWRSEEDEDETLEEEENENNRTHNKNGQDWLNVVRSIGAFVGIAFAIRKLPWQSALQLNLTLALVNPAIWYLLDRSSTGFILSTFVAIIGTALLLVADPALVPAPGPKQAFQEQVGRHAGSGIMNGSLHALRDENYVLGIFSLESVGVATWIASVLFVSAVCFGNIGRRLVGNETT